jgi:hypothetical protein
MLAALVSSKSRLPLADADTRSDAEIARYSPWQRISRSIYLKVRAHLLDAAVQTLGMVGLFHTFRRTIPWAWRLRRGNIEHSTHAPGSQIPMCSPTGAPASHALPGTEIATIPIRNQRLMTIDSLPLRKAA